MPTLALSVICKGDSEITQLKRMLDSAIGQVDHTYITCNNGSWDEVKKLETAYPNLSVDFKEWTNHFAEMRNYNLSLVKEDYFLWLDSDDELVLGEVNLKNIVQRMDIAGVAGLSVPYLYAQTENGFDAGVHKKVRLVRNNGIKWVNRVHENPDVDASLVEPSDAFHVLHHFEEEGMLDKQMRNYSMLMTEMQGYEDGKEDPRTIGYIGRTAWGIAGVLTLDGEEEKARMFLDQAIASLNLFDARSGWPEERYFNLMILANAYKLKGDDENRVKSLLKAVSLFPAWCDAYWHLCIHFNTLGDFGKACDWGRIALSSRATNSVLDDNRELRSLIGPLAYVDSLLAITRQDIALDILGKMDEKQPMVRERIDLALDIEKNIQYQNFAASFIRLLADESPDNLSSVVEAMPGELVQSQKVASEFRQHLKRKEHKGIVIFCGMGIGEDWAPPSLITGVGGSEEAVIHVARELASLGHTVTVYNSCGEYAGEYDSVIYKPWTLFNMEDSFETLIFWRNTYLSSNPVNAKNAWIWLHDVTTDSDFIEGVNNDKVLFLSKYHRSLAPSVPEEKVIYSQNGLTIPPVKATRVPGRVLYASSYDRGLEHLLVLWPIVKQSVPSAELHICYGWNTFDRLRNDPESKAWKVYMDSMMKQEGITHHGKLGAKGLANLVASSDVWCYPCHFEEISCITAMRAQALGAWPVCTNYAALEETVFAGDKVSIDVKDNSPDAWMPLVSALINRLQNPASDTEREEMMKEAKSRYSWSKVAKDWSDNFKK